MTTTPPSGEDPKGYDLKNLMPPPSAPASGAVSWQQVSLAIVSAAFTLGTAWLAGHSSQSASTAQQSVAISQDMLDKARARAAEIEAHADSAERRIAELEKWRAKMEGETQKKQP